MCPVCASPDVAWEQSPGTGVVYSYTIVNRNAEPFFQKRIPYVLALVDVAPGFRMMTNIVNVSPEDVKIGMPVRVIFEVASPEIGFPLFEPANA